MKWLCACGVVLRGQTAIFLQGIITFSISACKNRVWSHSYCKVVLDTSEPTGGVKMLEMLVEASTVLIDGLRI